jgi:hypothetical protein
VLNEKGGVGQDSRGSARLRAAIVSDIISQFELANQRAIFWYNIHLQIALNWWLMWWSKIAFNMGKCDIVSMGG